MLGIDVQGLASISFAVLHVQACCGRYLFKCEEMKLEWLNVYRTTESTLQQNDCVL